MDTIANMITTLQNAQKVSKARVVLPYSRFNEALANFLVAQDMVAKVKTKGEGPAMKLVVTLAYAEDSSPTISGMRRLSKPGRRLYARHDDIPYCLDGFGTVVLSTSKGLMSDKQARKEKMGGELICEIW